MSRPPGVGRAIRVLTARGKPTASCTGCGRKPSRVCCGSAAAPGYTVASSAQQHSLVLLDVGRQHQGTYTCIACAARPGLSAPQAARLWL